MSTTKGMIVLRWTRPGWPMITTTYDRDVNIINVAGLQWRALSIGNLDMNADEFEAWCRRLFVMDDWVLLRRELDLRVAEAATP